MELIDAINKRQSNRKYKNAPVEIEKIMQCIDAARLAPSANNAQEWKFVVVQKPELLKEVQSAAAFMGMNGFAKGVPAFVAVVTEKTKAINNVDIVLHGKDYKQMDIGLAIANFCLRAADLGLGTCIMGWFNEGKIKQLLQVPRGRKIWLMLAVGYPDDVQREKSRKSLKEISSVDKY